MRGKNACQADNLLEMEHAPCSARGLAASHDRNPAKYTLGAWSQVGPGPKLERKIDQHWRGPHLHPAFPREGRQPQPLHSRSVIGNRPSSKQRLAAVFTRKNAFPERVFFGVTESIGSMRSPETGVKVLSRWLVGTGPGLRTGQLKSWRRGGDSNPR